MTLLSVNTSCHSREHWGGNRRGVASSRRNSQPAVTFPLPVCFLLLPESFSPPPSCFCQVSSYLCIYSHCGVQLQFRERSKMIVEVSLFTAADLGSYCFLGLRTRSALLSL